LTSITRQRAMQVLRLVGAPLLLAGVVWLAGPRAIWEAVQGADAGWLLAGLLCATLGNASAALRWAELARTPGASALGTDGLLQGGRRQCAAAGRSGRR
jgi:hypothetical protein